MTSSNKAEGRGQLAAGGFGSRLIVILAFGTWFWLVYGLCDLLADNAAYRYDLETALDDWLPFVPEAATAYLLINLLLIAPAFVVRDAARRNAFYATLAIEVAVAGMIFIAFPVEPLAVPAMPVLSPMWLADQVNLTYNMFPSLHVALALSCGMVLSCHLPVGWKTVLWLTVAAVVVSTVLTKQHYVADVAGGAALAVAGMRMAFPRLLRALS